MSQRITQPVQSVRLTNVAVVRMNRHGKRFEIACYRNKVVNYRQGLETDLSEVLQTDRIFTNVSKGKFASTSELQEAFGTTNQDEVAVTILKKGNLQMASLERQDQYESICREIANWVAANCVHPVSQRPYTPAQIRHAMHQSEFKVHPTKSIKPQYLQCVKLLQSTNYIQLERAKMELCIKYKEEMENEILQELRDISVTPSTVEESSTRMIVLVDPSLYRPIDALCKRVGARLEILRQVVTQEGDVNLESELERKKQTVVDQEETLGQELQEKLHISSDQQQQETRVNDSNDTETPTNLESDSNQATNMRKNQKRAQKQSKKAKRREKEEAAERQVRVDAEKKRQELRAMERAEKATPTTNTTTAAKMSACNTCGGSFATVALYRAHFRSDWHRYNVKLKMKGIEPVSEEEFLLCDSDAFFEDTM